jgi:alpha-amylase/alpha-mannosidase (GH57 family)
MVDSLSATAVTPLNTATGVYVCVHGHFYQPPRENPYLDAIERQPSAAPFQNWNERILYESYRPNAFARILDHHNRVIDIVNNYEYISFNIGPTLMSWLERHDLETYQRILDADRKSCERLGGHGNAIAQVYNHIILPLANQRDKVTQVRWGIADFRARFGRDPEGMWLAETGVDYPTLSVLVQEGIKFTILAPSQAQRCRQMFGEDHNGNWHEVGGGQIDPTRPYRCFLKEAIPGCDRNYIDLFFYDGPISRDMGFNDILGSSDHFAGRLGLAVRGDHRPSQLIAVATDGETFGHHRGGAEKALAYAVTHAFPEQGWTVTNFAHYLSLCPPTWEVELKPVTAWSCSHGVDRWQDDCGCGGGGDWNQQWRRPLREALDWLRDQLIEVYETTAPQYFQDPWATRNDYARVMCDRSPSNVTQFLEQHQTHPLSTSEQVDALRLLEMQRHALLMYTSCGWFFDEISRPEGTQILRYASRALELAGEVAGIQLETSFVHKLSHAPSNVASFKDGAEIYHQLVTPSRVSLEQVAAHYAMSSLFNTYHHEQRLYCYRIHQLDYQFQRIGPLTLAVGQLDITSEITQEQAHLVFTVFHMGSWDFHCCIQPFRSRLSYTQAKTQLFEALSHASTAQVLLSITHLFGEQCYNLQNLFPEERHRIMQMLSQDTLHRLDQLYTQVYRDNYGILRAFHRDHLSIPQELQVAAEIALGRRAMQIIQALEQEVDSELPPPAGLDHLSELEATATESSHFHCHLKLPGAKQSLERLILRSLQLMLSNPIYHITEANLQWLSRLISVGESLHLGISLDRAQELYYQFKQPDQHKAHDPLLLRILEQLLAISPVTAAL